MKNATKLITEKRNSHNKKGFDYKHDTQHQYWEFILAARAYIDEDKTQWPFSDGFNLSDTVENLVNAGALICAAIDRLQRYEVGKIYEHTDGLFRVTKISIRKNADVWVYFRGVGGSLMPVKQSFMLSSNFDQESKLSLTQIL